MTAPQRELPGLHIMPWRTPAPIGFGAERDFGTPAPRLQIAERNQVNQPNNTALSNHEPIPPRMAHLPRHGHLAVPWIVRWDMKAPMHQQIGLDPELGVIATCDCVPGEGKPRFADLCYARLRQAMTDRLCGQCGAPLDGPMLWSSYNDSDTWREPASHPECLAYAMRACPELKRSLDQKPDFSVVEASAYWLHPERRPNRLETGPWHYFPEGTPNIVQNLRGGMLFAFLVQPVTQTRYNASEWLQRHLRDIEAS